MSDAPRVARDADLSDAALRELIEAGKKAIARPWTLTRPEADPESVRIWEGNVGPQIAALYGGQREENAAYIAQAANLAVPMAEALVRARDERDELREAVQRFQHHFMLSGYPDPGRWSQETHAAYRAMTDIVAHDGGRSAQGEDGA